MGEAGPDRGMEGLSGFTFNNYSLFTLSREFDLEYRQFDLKSVIISIHTIGKLDETKCQRR